MTKLLQEAIETLRSLPENEQDRYAGFLLREIEHDRKWEATSIKHAAKLRKLLIRPLRTTKPGGRSR